MYSQLYFQPFTYAVCLNELGNEIVHQYVGQVRETIHCFFVFFIKTENMGFFSEWREGGSVTQFQSPFVNLTRIFVGKTKITGRMGGARFYEIFEKIKNVPYFITECLLQSLQSQILVWILALCFVTQPPVRGAPVSSFFGGRGRIVLSKIWQWWRNIWKVWKAGKFAKCFIILSACRQDICQIFCTGRVSKILIFAQKKRVICNILDPEYSISTFLLI